MKKIALKTCSLVILLLTISLTSFAQKEHDNMAEERARELHKAISNPNKDERQEFVKTNYAEAFLEQYEMKMHTGMLDNLNRDFGDSKIKSIKLTDSGVNMSIERKSDGHTVYFMLDIEKDSPYKIKGVNIEAGELGG